MVLWHSRQGKAVLQTVQGVGCQAAERLHDGDMYGKSCRQTGFKHDSSCAGKEHPMGHEQ